MKIVRLGGCWFDGLFSLLNLSGIFSSDSDADSFTSSSSLEDVVVVVVVDVDVDNPNVDVQVFLLKNANRLKRSTRVVVGGETDAVAVVVVRIDTVRRSMQHHAVDWLR